MHLKLTMSLIVLLFAFGCNSNSNKPSDPDSPNPTSNAEGNGNTLSVELPTSVEIPSVNLKKLDSGLEFEQDLYKGTDDGKKYLAAADKAVKLTKGLEDELKPIRELLQKGNIGDALKKAGKSDILSKLEDLYEKADEASKLQQKASQEKSDSSSLDRFKSNTSLALLAFQPGALIASAIQESDTGSGSGEGLDWEAIKEWIKLIIEIINLLIDLFGDDDDEGDKGKGPGVAEQPGSKKKEFPKYNKQSLENGKQFVIAQKDGKHLVSVETKNKDRFFHVLLNANPSKVLTLKIPKDFKGEVKVQSIETNSGALPVSVRLTVDKVQKELKWAKVGSTPTFELGTSFETNK